MKTYEENNTLFFLSSFIEKKNHMSNLSRAQNHLTVINFGLQFGIKPHDNFSTIMFNKIIKTVQKQRQK